MFVGILSVMGLIVGLAFLIFKDKFTPKYAYEFRYLAIGVAIAIILLSLVGLASRSWVTVPHDRVGLLKRIYFAKQLPPGRIVASSGQAGPQAEILGPGFHFSPLIKILNEVDESPVFTIDEGTMGLITALDGIPLREGQFMADAWPEDKVGDMLNAEYFLANGGQKGPQLTVLRPGSYRINPYLFEVSQVPAHDVPTGTVSVIRSNVRSSKVECTEGTLTVVKGCIGVWDEPLKPGRYYLNPKAYVTTTIPTRIQTWVYKGGYVKRRIDLTVSDNGEIKQHEISDAVETPADAADKAITVRSEGWTIPVEMRVLVSVSPENAPKVVSSVGTLVDVENRIVTPSLRDELRTIGGKGKVMDFIGERDVIAHKVLSAVADKALEAGVTIREIRLGEPAIPPELLVANLRQQLAEQLKATYEKEREAQANRIKVEQERATADQQAVLVKAQIEKQAAKFTKAKLKLEGEGERDKLTAIAQGQEAQVRVLGPEKTLQLQMTQMVLDVARTNPEIIKIPYIQVIGTGGGSLEGAAAILGASNIGKALSTKVK